MARRSGRQVFFWAAVLLFAAVALLDLTRGRDSALRGFWSGLHMSRSDQVRSFFIEMGKNQPRSRGR